MSTAEQLGETWTGDILETWRQVFDAACKEAGWTPAWAFDPDHGWLVDNYSDSTLSDEQILIATNIGRQAVGFRPLTMQEYHRT